MLLVPTTIAKFAVRQLANADYTIATKISDDVAVFVPWALDHDIPYAADFAMTILQSLDELGSFWIFLAVWLVRHTHE